MSSAVALAGEVAVVALSAFILRNYLTSRTQASHAAPLPSAPRQSWLLGTSIDVSEENTYVELEKLAESVGCVFSIPGPWMGLTKGMVVVMDAKAIAHVYARDTEIYQNLPPTRDLLAKLLGKGLLWAEGDAHKRQRKSLMPAFSNAATREITPVFFDVAHKVRSAWDTKIGGSQEAIIDIENWLSRLTLDGIGIAGFGHDFRALEGPKKNAQDSNDSDQNDDFDLMTFLGSFSIPHPSKTSTIIFTLLRPLLKLLLMIPSRSSKLLDKMNVVIAKAADTVIEQARKAEDGSQGGHSIIETLLRAEKSTSSLSLTGDELLAQMKLFILAGYEATSVTLTYALMEIAKNSDVQKKLRAEITGFGANEPTYDQLVSDLPYLHAVMCEALRLHAPAEVTVRIAVEDDVLPLSKPLKTTSGTFVDSIALPQGSRIIIPIHSINRSEAVWGPSAKAFDPSRWLGGDAVLPASARAVQGFQHLLTFSDGGRACAGRGFATTEIKAVLFVLVRSFEFSMRDGEETKVERVLSLMPRPSVVGESKKGATMPMRVRRAEA